jgi:hypothetical protein
MRILAIAQVENKENLLKEIAKQTVQPDKVYIYEDKEPAEGINARRVRIAENHSKLRSIVDAYKPDLVWQLEQDCVLPDYTLKLLLEDYEQLKSEDFGYVSGIQLGRHGLYSIGAWHMGDDTFQSVDPKSEGLQQVDATGFYCLLAPTEVWLKGIASWNGEPWGPDVNWGLSLNYEKYVDMDLHIGHDSSNSEINRGVIYPNHVSVCQVKFSKVNGEWKYKTT